MPIKVVVVTNNLDHRGFKQLIRSMEHFKIDYEVLNPSVDKDQAWARNYEYVYEWCKTQEPSQEFIFTDGWDTFFLSNMEEIELKIQQYNCKMVVSGEGVAFPSPHLGDGYDDNDSPWKYVSAGGFFTTCGYFIKLIVDSCFMTIDGVYSFGKLQPINQQDWLAMMHLLFRKDIKIDYECKVFQPLRRTLWGVEPPNPDPDYKIEGNRLKNNITGEYPSIIHGNGGIPMERYYELI